MSRDNLETTGDESASGTSFDEMQGHHEKLLIL